MYEIELNLDSPLSEENLSELMSKVRRKLTSDQSKVLHFSVKQYPAIELKGGLGTKPPSIRISAMAEVDYVKWSHIAESLVPYGIDKVSCKFHPSDIKRIYVDFDNSWIIQMDKGEPMYVQKQLQKRLKEWGIKKWRIIRQPYDSAVKLRLV